MINKKKIFLINFSIQQNVSRFFFFFFSTSKSLNEANQLEKKKGEEKINNNILYMYPYVSVCN